MAQSEKISEIISDLKNKAAQDGDSSKRAEITVGDVVSALNYRGYGPLLLIISLLAVLPTGAIPGVPTLTALIIVFVSVQMLVGKKSPWIPSFLAKRRISRSKFESVCEQGEKVSQKMDRVFKPRFSAIVNPWSVKLIALVCCVIALSIPPLEFLPFVVFIPAVTMALFGIGLSVRDGLLIILAFIWLVFGVFIVNYLM